MPRAVLSAALAITLLTSTACSTMSRNNHRGVRYLGGAAAIVGLVMVADGARCDENDDAMLSCEGENSELLWGGVMLGGGLAAIAATYVLLKTSGQP